MRRLIAVTLSLATWTVAVAVVSVLAAHRSAAGWWLLLIPAGLLLALAFSVALGFHGSHGGLPAFLLGQFPADPRLLPRTVHMERTGSAPTVEAQAVIDLDHPLHRVDERFLSVAVDLSQVVEGRWWDPAARHVEFSSGSLCSPRFDFDRPQLDRLTAALSPLYLRIGGSEADKVFHALDDDPAIPPGYQSVLTRSQWDRITAFCQRNDCRLVFTLNAGPGARQANGNWDPRNAEALFAHAAQGPHVDVWELGNELNVFFFVHGLRDQVPVDQYCRDLDVLRRQIDRLSPGSQLAGQGSAFWPALGEPLSWFFGYSREMLRQAGDLLDLFTWHYYPQQSRRCVMGSRRAHPARLLDPSALDEAAHWATRINTWRDMCAPGLPVWLGETGNANAAGPPACLTPIWRDSGGLTSWG
jgi:heparanase 1